MQEFPTFSIVDGSMLPDIDKDLLFVGLQRLLCRQVVWKSEHVGCPAAGAMLLDKASPRPRNS
jgi:hypothetical protein